MFQPSRDQARRVFFDTWRKHEAGEPLEPMEQQVLPVILQHPEYHPLLRDPERYLLRDYRPEQGATNPFLHLGMHLALAEQRSIDQPAGIGERLQALALRHGMHEAEHRAMECLAEMIWQAQREGLPPDGTRYLACLDGHLGTGPRT